MFSVWEVAVIGGVALLVYGPEELPGVVKSVSQQFQKFRQLTQSITQPDESAQQEAQLKENQAKAKAADAQYQSD